MDPFFALVQALACAAHLATPNQYERLRRHVFRGRFREPADVPQLDVYVLFRSIEDTDVVLEPTVIDGVRQDDELSQKEVFGPVITVHPFSDEDEAVRWANGVPFGLASSVWTEDHGRAMRMPKRLDFGCVWINRHIPLVAEMPHGGYRKSGHGKDLSLYGLEDYTRIKHVMSYIQQRPSGA